MEKSVAETLRKLNLLELLEAGLLCLDGQFFPSVHYPPITMYPPVTEETLFSGYTPPPDGLFSVYAHIPFCMRHCLFCHYPVKLGELREEKDRYLASLENETDIYMRRLGLDKIKARSVLVGGGSPTYLTTAQLKRFLASFTARVDLSPCVQFSYDVDPVTLLGAEGAERLKILKAYGVHRLTIGIQSFDDAILKKMNRPHDARQALESVLKAQLAGFKINIEFIYGYPGQSLQSWKETVEKSVRLGVDEIQLYRLKVIPYGDRTGSITRKFSVRPGDFIALEQMMRMKVLAAQILAGSGYSENLTRVFSRTSSDFSRYAADQCCNLFDQIGLGLTAFSSLRDRFILNTQDFEEYYSLVSRGRLPLNRGLVRTRDDQSRWALVLPLKNRKVFKNHYKRVAGVSLDEMFRVKIQKLKEFKLLSEDDKTLALTERGRVFADEVCHQFHRPECMPFPASAYAHGDLHPYGNDKPADEA